MLRNSPCIHVVAISMPALMVLIHAKTQANCVGTDDCVVAGEAIDGASLLQTDKLRRGGMLTRATTSSTSHAYVPGTPGAAWSQEEVFIVKAKLWRMFFAGGNYDLMNKLHPNGHDFWAWADFLRPAPKMLRLGFHDCLRYADGSGGCDGCLNWDGMGERYDDVTNTYSIDPNNTLNGNNGLTAVVQLLEAVYRDPGFPERTPRLAESLWSSGKSRADLWAFATIVAVEHGIEINNGVCRDKDYEKRYHGAGPLDFNSGVHCHHLQGSSECFVNLTRPMAFKTGRRDCVTEATEGYKTSKVEVHPEAEGSGRSTAVFFKEQFGFTGRETVAVMGAHTMGRLHYHTSLFRYVWVKDGGMMFNNQYYRNLVGKRDFRFKGDNCRQVGDAWGQKPKARWLPHVRGDTTAGGPVHWIQEKLICPEKCGTKRAWKNDCCTTGVPEGGLCRPNCQQWTFASGLDEMALPSEIGLYLDFEVDKDKIPYGCPNLTDFNLENWKSKGYGYTWSGKKGVKGEPGCGKQMLESPIGSTPLFEIMEEYADHQDNWIRDFVPALEKMLANGYTAGDLTDGPDHWSDVVCPEQDSQESAHRFWACYSQASLSKPLLIRSVLDGRVLRINAGTGKSEMWTRQSAGDEAQLWRRTSFGNHIVNVASGRLLSLWGRGSWTFSLVKPKVLVSEDGFALDRGWSQEDGAGVTVWRAHGAVNQQWEFVLVEEGSES
eukprot:TRINITY_DN70365_c0_g1_i1.p1 TRINITY_DN70365_c0_g1~~TRINITY_DN70365_c0_g1_i1.p1  ORF type:complete len:716 (+),score=97.82 TRINITY_DN70365_c0_g1_i1:89-2236(+)